MIGTTLQNRYRIDSELGRGGMGVVYRARDGVLNRFVAVKVLSQAGLGTEGRARLLTEAQAVAKLNHPNIVTVYDAGEAEGAPFVVMELVEGESLRVRPPAGMEAILATARQICAALEHAHAAGIIHRDLKPENIVVTRTQTAKLMDFGLARSVDAPQLTEEGSIVGTFSYLAPELITGGSASAQSDLYALGVMLYELTTGRPPFAGENLLAVLSQHLHATVVPPSTHNPALPPAFETLILRLLNKQPEARPASATEVRETLEQISAGTAAPAASVPASSLDRIVRGQLVARDRELTQADALWRKALGGEGGTLLISGEPGIGKTRLVRELVTRAELARATALVGECYAEGGAPYAAIAQIIHASVPALEGDHALPDPNLADLITLAPDLGAQYPHVSPNPPVDPQSDQQRLFESFVKLCSVLAARAPVLLVVDDAHWADGGSLALVRHLARRIPRLKLKLLLVLTYREIELSEARALNELLADLNRERLAERIKLVRLDREETRDLLAVMFAEEVTPEFLEVIYRETEGNPFFVEEICKALIDDGKLYRENGHWRRPSMSEIQVPQSVRVAIEIRTAKLSGPVQEALRLAAVIGREFDFVVLQMAGEQTEDALIEALEAAEHAQLVGEIKRGGKVAFAFAHALIPATLRESVSGLRLQRLHRKVAGAITTLRPDDFEVLAYHHAQGGDEEQARKYYALAAERALTAFSNAEAERYYRAALELGGSDNERAGWLTQLAQALRFQSRTAEGLDALHEAIPLFRSAGNFDGLAQAYAWLSRLAWEHGDIPAGLTHAREGLQATAGQPDSPGLANLLQEAARACYFNRQLDEGFPLSQQALEMTERLGLIPAQAEALITTALFPNLPGPQRRDLVQRAVDLAEAHGLPATAARGHNNLSIAYSAGSGELRISREHNRRAVELARQIGRGSVEAWHLAQFAGACVELGDLTAAETSLAQMRRLLDESVNPGQSEIFALGIQSWIMAERGELTPSVQLMRPALALARQQGQLQAFVAGVNGMAPVLLELDDLSANPAYVAEAEALLLEAVRISDSLAMGWDSRAQLERLYCRQNRLDDACRILTETKAKSSADMSYQDQTSLALMEARLAAAEKRWPEAITGFADADEREKHMERPYWRAEVLREWAAALAQRNQPGDNEQAQGLLRTARGLMESMALPYRVKQIDTLLARLGA